MATHVTGIGSSDFCAHFQSPQKSFPFLESGCVGSQNWRMVKATGNLLKPAETDLRLPRFGGRASVVEALGSKCVLLPEQVCILQPQHIDNWAGILTSQNISKNSGDLAQSHWPWRDWGSILIVIPAPEPGPRHAILQELWPEHNVDGKILQAKQIQGFQLTCGSFSLLLFAIFTSVQSHRPFPYGTIVRHLQIMLITNFHWLPLSFLGFHQLSRNSISSCSHLRTSLILNEVLHATGGGIGRLAPEWCQNFSNAGHEHLLVQELTCMCIYVRACNR